MKILKFPKNIKDTTASQINSIFHISEKAKEICISDNNLFIDARIVVKDGATLKIGKNCIIRGLLLVEENSSLFIGDSLTCNNEDLQIRSSEGKSVSIGNNCLFANPYISNSDYHAIYDAETKKRLNHAKNIIIQSKVWLALNTVILKGSVIPWGCVVAAGSTVRKSHSSIQSVLAGSPAIEVRTGIIWSNTIHAEPSEQDIKINASAADNI